MGGGMILFESLAVVLLLCGGTPTFDWRLR